MKSIMWSSILAALGLAGLVASAHSQNKLSVGPGPKKTEPSTNAWQLSGNSGTSAGTHFLGTTDNQPLELKANNRRALRIEPNTNSPNMLGGFGGNHVSPGLTGVTISGGGGTYIDYDDTPPDVYEAPHTVSADFVTIAGGLGNSVASYASSIGGGLFNGIDTRSDFSAIGGGIWNLIGTNAVMSTIGGGELNVVQSDAVFSTIAGGIANTVQGAFSFVGGGGGNLTDASARDSTIAGGGGNICAAPLSTIPGGMEAHAFNYGQWAYSSGQFTGELAGRAQTSLLVARCRTFDATPTELLLDGGEVGRNETPPRTYRIHIPNGARWNFEATVVGARPDGTTACFQSKGVIKNVSNITTFVGTASVSALAADTGAQSWNVSIKPMMSTTRSCSKSQAIPLISHGLGLSAQLS
jgi:hypothetical protein